MRGFLGAPKTPQNAKIRGFGGPQTPPQNIFGLFFYHLIILYVLSAFQGCFTNHFHKFLRDFMIIFFKNGFLGGNLGILYSKNGPKLKRPALRQFSSKTHQIFFGGHKFWPNFFLVAISFGQNQYKIVISFHV